MSPPDKDADNLAIRYAIGCGLVIILSGTASLLIGMGYLLYKYLH